ncbi:unnamed protein product, partial [Effrenium voratum]
MTSYFQHRSVAELTLASPEWLQEKNVQLIFARARCIKREQRRVVYEGPNTTGEIEYDELVLATGSSPFVPPVPGLKPSLPGVFLYRTIEDMDGIIARAACAGKRAAVIGGGLLGLEAAKALMDLRMEVSVLEAAPILMSAQLDFVGGPGRSGTCARQGCRVAGSLLEKRLAKLGLQVFTGVELQEEVLGNDAGVRYVKLLRNGEETFLEMDLLVVSCGIRPRDELAREVGLELGERGGVKVDSCLRSSDPHIYAVGEVAAYEATRLAPGRDKCFFGGLVYGLWKPGAEQAEVLAAVLGSPVSSPGSARYHGSDLSTKLKLLGVNVACFGANAEFWKNRIFDFQDGQANICVTTALDAASFRYRKLIFRRLPCGSRRLIGGILVESVEDYPFLCDLARCGRELWGLEPVVMTHGPSANPGMIEEQVYPTLRAPKSLAELYAPKRVVIVGYGPIGHAVIQNLVEQERAVAITVICEEPRAAYNRVAMTSYFQHRSVAELTLASPEWLQEKNVQLIFAKASCIQRDQRRVVYKGPTTAGEIEYDELVLATGSSPFVPPVPGLQPSAGVFLYRTIEDAEEDMDAIIARAKGRRKAAVIGGGLLGLEAVKALLDLGLEVAVLEVAPQLMPSQLDS